MLSLVLICNDSNIDFQSFSDLQKLKLPTFFPGDWVAMNYMDLLHCLQLKFENLPFERILNIKHLSAHQPWELMQVSRVCCFPVVTDIYTSQKLLEISGCLKLYTVQPAFSNQEFSLGVHNLFKDLKPANRLVWSTTSA